MMLARPQRVSSMRVRQSGAVAVLVALSMTVLMGFVALAIDTGRIVHIRRALQASTDSAALAGGRELVRGAGAADTVARRYGAESGAYNPVMGMPASTVTSPRCLTSLTGLGVPCTGSPAYNALQVTQTITIPSTFAGIFDKASWTVSASSLASVAGGPHIKPMNIVLVLDTAAGMNLPDAACGTTRIACALAGIRVLLSQLKPSAANVGLVTFPPLTNTTETAKQYDCLASPTPTTTQYGNPAGVYAVIGSGSALVNDYKTSNTATALSTSSNLNKAVGAGGVGCTPLTVVGNQGTFYADAIRVAQSMLASQPNKASVDSVIVLLSDGNSGALVTNVVQNWVSTRTYRPGDEVNSSGVYYRYVAAQPTLASAATQPGVGVNWADYWVSLSGVSATKGRNQCAGAVAAAAQAKAAGTRIYSIGYSPLTSQSCPQDSPAVSACQTMRSIASDPSTFYSTTTTSSCASGGGMSLNEIFTSIAQNISYSRLLPLDAP
jgi:hypothetical protein